MEIPSEGCLAEQGSAEPQVAAAPSKPSVTMDSIMTKLYPSQIAANPNPSCQERLTMKEISTLCKKVMRVLLSQPVFLEIDAPVNICGDIHGQFDDLIEIFELCGSPQSQKYLFLGDYVDRGPRSIEVLCLLFAFKIRFPLNVFLLRGNHESSLSRKYGFYDECVREYDEDIWFEFLSVFQCLPIAALIGGKIFCVHGGICPGLLELSSLSELNSIQRPAEIPAEGLVRDMLWSDPSFYCDRWAPNPRGTGVLFGDVALRQFCRKFGVTRLYRGHQYAPYGIDFPLGIDRAYAMTVFSASNCVSGLKNKGAVIIVAATLDWNCRHFVAGGWRSDGRARFEVWTSSWADDVNLDKHMIATQQKQLFHRTAQRLCCLKSEDFHEKTEEEIHSSVESCDRENERRTTMAIARSRSMLKACLKQCEYIMNGWDPLSHEAMALFGVSEELRQEATQQMQVLIEECVKESTEVTEQTIADLRESANSIKLSYQKVVEEELAARMKVGDCEGNAEKTEKGREIEECETPMKGPNETVVLVG
jgi:serine/threonine-protein phosphatase PP1 catalytic subunit